MSQAEVQMVFLEMGVTDDASTAVTLKMIGNYLNQYPIPKPFRNGLRAMTKQGDIICSCNKLTNRITEDTYRFSKEYYKGLREEYGDL